MPATPLYHRYRHWEDGYVEMLDALDAGREPAGDWSGTALRRSALARCRDMSPAERRAMRDFIWRWRGWRGWLAVAVAAAISSLVGFGLHALQPQKFGAVEGPLLVTALAFGLGLALVTVWFHARRFRSLRLFVFWSLGGIAGALVAFAGAPLLEGRSVLDELARVGPKALGIGVPVLLGLAALLVVVATVRNRELDAENARLAADAERARLAQELQASRLRLVQAQIEPHFLFNTLGAVQQLAERGAPEAAHLTSQLIQFLRGAMVGMRAQRTTLAAEFELAQNYLRVMQVRLGARLAFALDLPDALRDVPLPPTLLITLVENAIKHGIEPSPSGGRIELAARLEPAATGIDADRSGGARTLVIEVADTGVGMPPTLPGSGRGLASVRDALALAFDGRAALELLEQAPTGVVARLRLPWPVPPLP